MSQSDRFYSWLVSWLKVALPLVALGILSTVFFLARSPDLERQIPFATGDNDDLANQDMIAAPSYVGVSPGGSAIEFSAARVRPEEPGVNRLIADGLSSRIETPEGQLIETDATLGQVDLDARIARFEGGVDLVTSDGIEVRAEDLTSHLDTVEIRTDLPVTATTPIGRIEAGSMVLSESTRDAYLLVFQGGVDLLYHPKSERGD